MGKESKPADIRPKGNPTPTTTPRVSKTGK